MELFELEGVLSPADKIVVPLVAVRGCCKLGTWEAGERMAEECARRQGSQSQGVDSS
jgi:hypothetical protein